MCEGVSLNVKAQKDRENGDGCFMVFHSTNTKDFEVYRFTLTMYRLEA